MGKDRCFWLQCDQPSGSFSMPSMAQQQAALLQVADGISGLNDINIDIDFEANQVESFPVQSSVSRYYAYSGKKGGTYSGCCLEPGRRQAFRHFIRMLSLASLSLNRP
jgi:hypothetical protein